MKPATIVNFDHDSCVSKDLLAKDGEDENLKNLYKVEDRPSFILSVLNALQICSCQLLSLVWLPLLLSPSLCILPAEPVRVQLVSTALLTSGAVTLLQSTVGIRLPTVAVPSAVYASSLLSLLHSPGLQCPSNGDLYAMGPSLRTQEWQTRLREVQGVLLFTGGLQTLLGMSGLPAFLSSALTPEVLAPAVILVGLSFIQEPLETLLENWTLSSLSITMFLMMIFFGLRDKRLLLPTFSIQKGLKFEPFYIFRMFPVLWACLVSYILYLTTTTIYKDKPSYQVHNQVVAFEEAVDNADQFYIPLPFGWGLPTLSMSSVAHILPAFILQSAIALVLFHGNADVCDARTPPGSSVSRGLTMEGVGLLLGALWGQGVATAPSSVGLTYYTGIASRSSTLLAALLMICASCSTAVIFAAANIPTQFLAVVHLCLHLGLVCCGISMLKFTNFSSQCNPVIIGFSLFFGLTLPQLVAANRIASETGFSMLDSFANQCLKSSVFIGMSTGCLLHLLTGKRSKPLSCLEKVKTAEENNIYRLQSWQEIFCNVLEQVDIFSANSK